MTLTTTTPETKTGTGVRPQPRAQVSVIGAKASGYLSAPGFSGEVVVASSRAAYIATDSGDILAACSPSQQPHPRSFLTDLDLSLFEVGQRVWVEGHELRFSGGVGLNLVGSTAWNRQPATRATAASPQQLRLKYDSLMRTARELHYGENFGLALPFLDADDASTEQVLLPNITSPLVSAGVQQIRELLPFCRCGNLVRVLDLSEELIGLGHGLTPSGDDFIGGLLFMARHLSDVYPEQKWWSGSDTSAFLNRSQAMTSKVSHALLSDLANGQSHESLHDLADDLLSSRLDFDAENHVRRVTQIGQSSGWDILTGMLAGLLPVAYRGTELKP